MDLTLRNVSYPPTDPGAPDLSAHWMRRERSATLPVDQTALVLIDVWDVESERAMNAPAGDRIVEERIAPLLEAARAADLLVIHAVHRPIGWDGINTGPSLDARGPDSCARDELPKEVASRPEDPG